MILDKEVLNVLDESTIYDMVLRLPDYKIDRKLYLKVNKVLQALGGKWNRKKKGFLFDGDPTDKFDAMVQSGKVVDPKKFYQFFETPITLVDEMMVFANVQPGEKVLEPSAGKGAIADKVRALEANVVCAELNPEMIELLVGKGYSVLSGDFMGMTYEIPYDKVVMNPPFSRQQDIDHIKHAFDFLKPGGILVSVVSEGPFFRTNKKAKAFREWLDKQDHEIRVLPEGTFKTSGTGVNTRLIKIIK